LKTAISIRNLYYKYYKKYVLENISLDIKKNEYVALIGPNGGGKTTLAKIILGFLKPTKGEVLILGKKPQLNRQIISYIPQNINFNIDIPLTAMDVVLQGRLSKNKLFYSKDDKKRALLNLTKVKMEEFKDKKIGELSGGQRQRVLIARALSCEPEILILDEPTASVDPKGQKEIYEILNKLHITKIVISHDINILFEQIDKVVYVNKNLFIHENIDTVIKNRNEHFCEVELLEYMKMFQRGMKNV